jgi:hypothetical protein
MLPGYRIASGMMVGLLGLSLAASYFGWGLSSDASARARSVREGSIHGRHYRGGGPGWGK